MKTEVNLESLEGMSFADYKKALKKDKKFLKKAKGVMFVNDHKFSDGKKGLAMMIFKKPKDVKECFKDLKKKGHPSPKMAGGSCEYVDGANGPELKVELKLGGLKEDKIIAKGKSFLPSVLGIMPTISAGDPKDNDGQIDAQEQGDVSELQAEFNELKNQLAGVKKAIENFKAGNAQQKDAVAVEEFVAEAKEWLIKFKNEVGDVKKQLKEQALKLKEQYTKLAPALTKIQEQADKNDPKNFLEKIADKAGDFIDKVKDKVEDLFDGDEDAWEDDDISEIGDDQTDDNTDDLEDDTAEDIDDSTNEDVEDDTDEDLNDEDQTDEDDADDASNDEDDAGVVEEALSPTSKITASVGKGGVNKPEDVLRVKQLLNKFGNSLEENGTADAALTKAIEDFQRKYRGSTNPDGRVDAGGRTWGTLIGIGRIQGQLLSMAQQYGVEPAVILAIQQIESGGNGFYSDGRPKILFEGHVFWKQLEKVGKNPQDYVAGNEDILYPKWDSSKYEGGLKEYDRLEKAKKIDEIAALKSASWGEFQIMGFNHATVGYSDVESFVEAMHVPNGASLKAVMEFVKNNNLLRHVQGSSKDWAAFARGYNGPGYAKNQYDKKLAAAYERFKAIT
jgi:hypothetical protein